MLHIFHRSRSKSSDLGSLRRLRCLKFPRISWLPHWAPRASQPWDTAGGSLLLWWEETWRWDGSTTDYKCPSFRGYQTIMEDIYISHDCLIGNASSGTWWSTTKFRGNPSFKHPSKALKPILTLSRLWYPLPIWHSYKRGPSTVCKNKACFKSKSCRNTPYTVNNLSFSIAMWNSLANHPAEAKLCPVSWQVCPW
jgi:hypothetical protein